MKYSVTLLLLAVMSAPLTALAKEEKPAITDKQLDKMQERLQLTDQQVSEMRKIRDDGGTNKDIRAVMNDEQKAQAQEMKKKRKENSEKSGKSGKKTKSDSGDKQ